MFQAIEPTIHGIGKTFEDYIGVVENNLDDPI